MTLGEWIAGIVGGVFLVLTVGNLVHDWYTGHRVSVYRELLEWFLLVIVLGGAYIFFQILETTTNRLLAAILIALIVLIVVFAKRES